MVPQLATNCSVVWSPLNGNRKDKAGRWERPAFLNQSALECGRSLGCVGGGFNERLGNRWRTVWVHSHNMRDVLRDVQCRISNLTADASYWGSLCGWYSKTNISRILITQTDTPQVDLSTAKAGS
jgi:hypothetical protein